MIIHWQVTFGLLLVLYISSSIGRKDSKVHTSKCPMLTECPYRAQQCSEDDDCSVDSICCKSPCGKVCTKQLFTGCQTLKNAASRRAKSLGVEEKSVRSPRCNKSGGFEPIQCDNEIVSSCWCVDEAGFELAGTKAPAASLVNCTAPKPCADHTCRMFCPHGFALDHDGCPLCRCRDPCSDIKCPNALECQLEDLACADPPCPPVPTCKKGRSLDSICPVGDPLRISETVRPFLCGNDPGKPTCPPLYQCLVQKGNDYGVCCPASLKVQKSGTCPVEDDIAECGIPCKHDLECQSIQKCCSTTKCGSTCVHPKNVTECTHQRSLSELLSVSERAGRGYVPQCSSDGEFEPKQCSRNGLVCWCVDRMGRKMRGSMGPSDSVSCDISEADRFDTGRSLDKVGNDNQCQKLDCAAICEYGFKLDENGCHTCKCDDPCDGYVCPEDEECISVKESSCTDFLCPSLPVCRPKAVYANPCESGAPLTDDMSGAPVACALKDEDGTICPTNYQCKAVLGSTQAVCCPMTYELEAEESAGIDVTDGRSQTMCEYLRDFSDSMEGTREGMNLALPIPTCNEDGNFIAMQCDEGQCWCVDNFGTEIPRTRGTGNSTKDCEKLRETMDCLDLTCRMGCEYGFILSEETGCPLCQCRDPCHDVKCRSDEQCQLVEVNCKDHYCPPVPACLPKKLGQCPYLVPSNSISCDFSCNSDLACNGTMKCCSNGCGTQCAEPLLYTACQHKRTLAQYQAHESGIPLNRLYIPSCNEDGSYAQKQCNLGTSQCWCVDQNGFELSGSRGTKTLDCDNPPKPSNCPLRKCTENCDHGYKIDDNGCRTCECINPCDDVKCRGDGETCRLVAVECVSSFCPAVPMCLPKKENPCQTGEPLTFDDEIVTCGPEEETCPSSHKCQLSPIGEYAVCCPKPRGICFEPLDKGDCGDQEPRNLTRFYFNSRTNKCDSFTFSGCQGNHNNFHTKELCNQVCPVLSQCERLREKNQKAAEKYSKPNFLPRCEDETGNWQAVQCLEHVGVCWCVSPQGTPLKGTLTRGAEPDCNFRQARNRAQNRADFISDADLVLEELMMQIGSLDDVDEPADLDNNVNGEVRIQSTISRCEDLGGQCDENKKFLPMQCEGQICWCVDEAGNQLPLTNTFMKGERICLFSPVEKVEVTLGFRGEYDDLASVPVVNRISKIVKNLGGVINDDGITADITSDALFIRFFLIGNKKIDIAYTLEQMVMNQHLPALTADITKSRVVHHLLPHNSVLRDNALSLENREIVSQSPVSVVAPYHTALIVVAAASAFVISILTLLVMLYRRKMNQLNSNNKVVDDSRFLSNTRPIYIELPNEKYNSLSSDLNKQSA